jgi:hypothetical protein
MSPSQHRRWAAAFLMLASMPGTAAPPADSWGVRTLGQRLESLSEVNLGKPSLRMPLASHSLARRQAGAVSIELRADAATTAAIAASGDDYAPELDQALAWLQRLQPKGERPTRILLTLVDLRHRHRERRVHGTASGLVVDLLVALPSRPADASVEVARGLSTALHEMSHAVAATGDSRRRPNRQKDEYRASLVQACYLVDTLRAGDTLRLMPRERAGAREHFVTAHSRNAARSVVLDLAKAAGTDTVRWHDQVAVKRLRQACDARLRVAQSRD